MTRALALPAVPAVALVLALAPPLAAQDTASPDPVPLVTEDDPDLVLPRAPEAPALFGAETEGFAAEEFYWMNPESDRWPDDLDPRDHEYIPSPEPNITFELDLSL